MSDLNQYQTYEHTESEAPSSHVQYQDHGTVDQVSISGNKMQISSAEVSRSSHENFKKAQEYNANAWRNTATNRMGMPTSNLTDDSIVTIGGMESSVRAHTLAGNLIPDGKGNWELSDAVRGIESSKPSESIQDDETIHQPPEVAQSINKALEPFTDTMVNAMMPRVIDGLSKGEDIAGLASQLSQLANINQDEALSRMNHVVTSYQVEAEHHLGKTFGLDQASRADLYAFAQNDVKGQQLLNEALQTQVTGRSMKGWESLVDHYYSTVPPSKEALAKAGIPTREGSNKETLIKLDGNWVSLKTATQLGWI